MKKSFTLLSLLLMVSLSALAQDNSAPGNTAADAPARGYVGAAEIGYLYQSNKNSALNGAGSSPTLTFFNGYQLHRLFSVGATIGLDFYSQVLVTPLALGIRGTLLKSRISPIYGVDAGYGSTLLSDESNNRENEGGWMINPAVGMRVKAGNNTAFLMSIGYKVQKATTTQTLTWNNNSFITQEHSFKRLSARLGFMF
ncbi:hypothetical protein ACFSC6_02305 [Rufibacter sediminis]|uniref:Outer membrane protein beta-barrel domain-containing protein n=1 Tax=Rufibacter sediminis TaxID=2762756 RepID=A0ABR6VWN8_9BACT|nr:hypothetical protein [Rufibacter sediminis]MBC3541595.1 hypothetical protein [Rufibacter sediminis]